MMVATVARIVLGSRLVAPTGALDVAALGWALDRALSWVLLAGLAGAGALTVANAV
ncbi:hypothetical protein ODZ83_04835 [Acaricomes phytoseiuli]|uniref:hypothetical protein n=1 Tax=Acaricomes phytoseiuli TaxID=291968 RepID=UPI001B7FD425|nr:hypothetical protein [Acaricomes phytoseiuli]MCW1249516.1 hypothetical protein [Acaricomes phytoseiuli]